MKAQDILIGSLVGATIAGGAWYFFLREKEEPEPEPGYPKTITRGDYSFTANSVYEETQLKEFLGIDPSGDDIDTHLSKLDNVGLDQWKSYWTNIFNNFTDKITMINFVNQKYNQYYDVVGYPKTITRSPYSFTANNEYEETQLNDFLGISPVGADIDTHLSGLTNAQLDQWKTYWNAIFINFIDKSTMQNFVQSKYNEYYDVVDYPKTITRSPYSFIAYNLNEETELRDFLGISPVGSDIDTHLSGLTNAQLDSWKIYWINIFNNFTDKTTIINFVNQKYNQYYDEEPIISAEIVNLRLDTAYGTYYPGSTGVVDFGGRVDTQLKVKNTGTSTETFYVGCTISDASGNYIDLPVKTITIGAGSTSADILLRDYVYQSAFTPNPGVAGIGNVWVTIWDAYPSPSANRLFEGSINLSIWD